MKPLAPEHLADLRKSGWNDDSISACECESVRPHDIKLKGVESAYRIPYFDLDGTRNCFERWRQFGGDQRYSQPPNSGVQIYLPPIEDWQNIAADPSIDLNVPEGEKKTVILCQCGIPALGVGGVWNWKDHTAKGDALIAPLLTAFVWKGRHVNLIPDSDGWKPEKMLDVLAALYALGMWLVAQGAIVSFVRLHDIRGLKKTGIDDFIVAHGEMWREAWDALERIPISDRRLNDVAAWWQSWKARQDSIEALRNREAEELELQESVGVFTCRSAKHQATFVFDRLHEHRETVRAELTVSLGGTILLDATDINLKSAPTQAKLSKELESLARAIPWRIMLQRACAMVLRRSRVGEPSVRLDRHGVVEPLTYTLNPLVIKDKIAILYATGGMGKSTLGLFLGLCASVGACIGPFRAAQGNVAYLDYEDDKSVHLRRVHAIQAEHPELRDASVVYQKLVEPVAKLTHLLARKVHEEQISLIILDSLLAATGGDSSAEATTKLFIALRALGVSCLIIGHVPKALPEGQEHQTVYGSVFNGNFARSVWELKKEQDVDDDSMILSLVHRKTNLSRLHAPIGLRVTQDRDTTRIRFESCDLSEVESLERDLPVASRIRTFLERDGKVNTAQEIAMELGIKVGTVKYTLSKHRRIKWQMVGEGRDAGWCVLSDSGPSGGRAK